MTEALDLQQRNRVALLALRTALVTWLILVGTRSETAVAVLALVLTLCLTFGSALLFAF